MFFDKKKLNNKKITLILNSILFVLFISFLVLGIIFLGDKTTFVVFYVLIFLTLVVNFWLNYSLNKKIYFNSKNNITKINSLLKKIEKDVNFGYLFYNSEGEIEYFSDFFNYEDVKIKLNTNLKNYGIDINEHEQRVKINNNYFLVKNNKREKYLIFEDIDKYLDYEKQINDNEIAIISIKKSFSNELSLNESLRRKVELMINDYFNDWSNNFNATYKSENQKEHDITIFCNWQKIKEEVYSENLLNNLLSKINDYIKDVTISIGIYKGFKDFNEIDKNSKKFLQISKNRGGNQIVFIDEDNKTIKNIGNSSLQISETSRTELKIFYGKLIESVKKFSKVFITTHQTADIDSLASSIALATILKEKNIDVKIILNDFDFSSKNSFKHFSVKEKLMFTTETEEMEKFNKNSCVIILDLSSIKRTQCYQLIKKLDKKNIFVIDHHRLSLTLLDFDLTNSYIDISSSSVSEIITQFLIFDSDKKEIILSKTQYEILFAGIYLDTNNLTRNTSEKTFECLEYLSNKGVSPSSLSKYNNRDLSFNEALISSIKNSEILNNRVLFTYIDKSMPNNDSSISFISDFMIGFKGVEASFVVGINNLNQIKLSARSNSSNINVQKITEKLGGGGHFNFAASNWKYENNFEKIISEIKEVIVNDVKDIGVGDLDE